MNFKTFTLLRDISYSTPFVPVTLRKHIDKHLYGHYGNIPIIVNKTICDDFIITYFKNKAIKGRNINTTCASITDLRLDDITYVQLQYHNLFQDFVEYIKDFKGIQLHYDIKDSTVFSIYSELLLDNPTIDKIGTISFDSATDIDSLIAGKLGLDRIVRTFSFTTKKQFNIFKAKHNKATCKCTETRDMHNMLYQFYCFTCKVEGVAPIQDKDLYHKNKKNN